MKVFKRHLLLGLVITMVLVIMQAGGLAQAGGFDVKAVVGHGRLQPVQVRKPQRAT